jgi:hypothetical protein
MSDDGLSFFALVVAPLGAPAAYVRAVLLARDQRLFLNVMPWRRK